MRLAHSNKDFARVNNPSSVNSSENKLLMSQLSPELIELRKNLGQPGERGSYLMIDLFYLVLFQGWKLCEVQL